MDYEINAKGNFAREQEKNAKATEKVAQEFKKLEEASARLEKAQLKWLNTIQTPQEKYNKKIEELNELQKKGALTAEQFAKAVKHCQDELAKATNSAKGLKDVDESIGGISDTLTKQVMKWGTVATAIGVAQQALEAYSKLGKEFEGNKAESDVALGRLQQIAGDQKQFNEFRSSGQAFATTGGTSLAEGYRTVNALQNIGAGDSADFIARLRRSEFIGEFGTALAPGIKSVQSNVAGAGDLKRILATALGAAGTNSLDLEPTLGYMSVVGSAAKPYGLSLEEVAALTSAGQTGIGKGEAGATAIASFLDETRAKGVFKPGMSIPELVAANKGTAYGTNAAKGYNALSDAAAQNYAQALATARQASASPEQYVLSRAGFAEASDPGFAARQGAREETIQLELAHDRYTTNEAMTERGVKSARRRVADNAAAATGAAMMGEVAERLPLGDTASYAMTGLGAVAFQTGIGSSPTGLLKSIRDLLRRQRPQAPPLPSASP